MAAEFPLSAYQAPAARAPAASSHHLSRIGSVATPNRVTTTFWEEENTIVYHVHVDNFQVSRRGDNNYVNGTKLFNVAGLTRGRRDGILKSERNRVVVKIGAMYLKGVWIPLERAKILAEKEGIADILQPLFAPDIHATDDTGHLQPLPSAQPSKPALPMFQPQLNTPPQMPPQVPVPPLISSQPPGIYPQYPQYAPQMVKYPYPTAVPVNNPADEWSTRVNQPIYYPNQYSNVYLSSNPEQFQQAHEYAQHQYYYPTYDYSSTGRVTLPTPPTTSRSTY